MTKKGPDPVDVHVGRRVRMRRLQLGVSQATLGDELGLTFQQIQKYEKGTNRMGASRLVQTARALNCGVGFFFEGAPGLPSGVETSSETTSFLATKDGVTICAALNRIADPKLRHLFAEMADAMACTLLAQRNAA